MSNRYHTIFWGVILGASCLAPAYGSEVGRLRAEVRTLQAQVRHLERRLGACVAARPAPAAPAATPAPPARASKATPSPSRHLGPPRQQTRSDIWRHEWQRLRRHMSERQVRALLGRPSRALMLGGKPVWYYDYGTLGNGSVAFGADRRVLAWQTPPFGSWW